MTSFRENGRLHERESIEPRAELQGQCERGYLFKQHTLWRSDGLRQPNYVQTLRTSKIIKATSIGGRTA